MRLKRHASECPECSRGIRALRALLRVIVGLDVPAPDQRISGAFDRVRADASPTSIEPDTKHEP
jgi:hypothetical protein